MPALAAVGLAAWIAVAGVVPAARWEGLLRRAAEGLRPVAEAHWHLSEAERAGDAGVRREHLYAALVGLVGDRARGMSPTFEAVVAELEGAQIRLIPDAVELLMNAGAVHPDEWRVRREVSRLWLAQAGLLMETGREIGARASLGRAWGVVIAGRVSELTSKEFNWLSLVYETTYALTGEVEMLHEATGVLERAAKGDPYNLDIVRRLFVLHGRLGDAEGARSWGERALELDEFARLDPEVRGLSDGERKEMREALGH